jgi:hypothetical protein
MRETRQFFSKQVVGEIIGYTEEDHRDAIPLASPPSAALGICAEVKVTHKTPLELALAALLQEKGAAFIGADQPGAVKFSPETVIIYEWGQISRYGNGEITRRNSMAYKLSDIPRVRHLVAT